MALYDQFGREYKREKKPDQRPLAVAPLQDSFREYVTDGLTPERMATIFKEADAGDMSRQAQLFDQLEERDTHLLCERDKRKNVILSLDWDVEPASDSAQDDRIAEFVKDFFAGLADWEGCLLALQDAVGKGYSALETCWDVSEGQALPGKFEFIQQRRLHYADMSGVVRDWPLLLTDNDIMGVEIPAWRAIIHKYGGKSGSPTRSGIYRVAAWMILFKHYAIKDWVVFCEVYGMPLRLGKYDQGASADDKAALLSAISSLGTDAAGIISKSTEIEFIESAQSALVRDLWKVLVDWCNGEISKAVVGQTLSAEVGSGGSYAAAKTHEGVRMDLLLADGRALAGSIRDQLIRPIVGFNFGWDAAVPRFRAVLEKEEDLGKKADWFAKLTDKVAVPAEWARLSFGVPEPKPGEEMAGGQPAPAAGGISARMVASSAGPAGGFVFTAEQQAVEDLADRATAGVDLSANEKKILAAVMTAKDFDEAAANLVKLYPDLDMGPLRDMTERAIFAADLYGRKVVQLSEAEADA